MDRQAIQALPLAELPGLVALANRVRYPVPELLAVLGHGARSARDLAVLAVWCVVGLAITLRALVRRG